MIPESIKAKIKLEKRSENTPEGELFGAFDNDDILTFTLSLPRECGACSPFLELYRDADNALITLPFIWQGYSVRDAEERYLLRIKTSELCGAYGKDYKNGLFYYTVVLDTAYFRHRISYNDTSYTPKIAYADDEYRSFSLTVYEKIYTPPRRLAGGIMYHIFVDRFCRGGAYPPRGDAVMNDDWDNGIPEYAAERGGFVKNNMFFGGTLTGVTSKLDYLSSLGVSVIYLSPVFEAYSNHKYDTGCYDRVDPMFGGDSALEELIKEAGLRGISIILDGVFNHTGSDSVYFNKNNRYDCIGAYQSPDSPYYSWYSFDEYPDSYRCWWGVDILPEVNTTDKGYSDYICGENGIVRRWLRKGIAGWRLDVADELSKVFMERLTAAAKEEREDAAVIGEVWEDASDKVAYGKRREYFRGRQLDSVMNYPLRDGIIRFVKNGDSTALFKASVGIYSHYPKSVSDNLMNFLGTHDTERILTVLGTDGGGERTEDELASFRMSEDLICKAVPRLKMAYTLLAFMPGFPCIYYGDEAGAEGFHDPFNRMPYHWGHELAGLVEHYKKIGMLRRSDRVFADGYFRVCEGLPEGVFAFYRYNSGKKTAVVANRSGKSFTFSFGGKSLLGNGDFKALTLGEGDFDVIVMP